MLFPACRLDSAVVERAAAACLVLGLVCFLSGHSTTAQESPAATESPESITALRGVVIPTGFRGGKYSAMIQVAVDGSPLPNAAWGFDASFTSGDRAPKKFSGRIVAEQPGAPVVFEAQVEFEPGSYVLTLAAQETTAGQSETRRLEGRWPDPGAESGTISPIVVLQPAQGVFKRGENTRKQGALAQLYDVPVRIQLPTALVSVVCRGEKISESVRVERKLEGASVVDFEPIDLLPGQDQCAQVRDMIPPGTMGAGHFRYGVRLLTDSGEIAATVREFTSAGAAAGSRPGS